METIIKIQKSLKASVVILAGILEIFGLKQIVQAAMESVACSDLMSRLSTLAAPLPIPLVKISPSDLIPILSQPDRVLALCSFANIGTAIFQAVVLTALCVGVSVWIINLDARRTFHRAQARRRARLIARKIEELKFLIENTDPDEVATYLGLKSYSELATLAKALNALSIS